MHAKCVIETYRDTRGVFIAYLIGRLESPIIYLLHRELLPEYHQRYRRRKIYIIAFTSNIDTRDTTSISLKYREYFQLGTTDRNMRTGKLP